MIALATSQHLLLLPPLHTMLPPLLTMLPPLHTMRLVPIRHSSRILLK